MTHEYFIRASFYANGFNGVHYDRIENERQGSVPFRFVQPIRLIRCVDQGPLFLARFFRLADMDTRPR